MHVAPEVGPFPTGAEVVVGKQLVWFELSRLREEVLSTLGPQHQSDLYAIRHRQWKINNKQKLSI